MSVKKFKGRHLHPSIYKKYKETKKLIRKGIDSDEFQNRGGIDLRTFEALKQRQENQDQLKENNKQKLISKYGSIKAAPISVGPCRKIEPVVGNKNALVLLTEFTDKKHTLEPQFFEDLLFSKGSTKSMRDYYLEASWNQLDITGNVIDQWYKAPGPRADYVDELPVNKHYPRAQRLIKEMVLRAKSGGKIDFTPFSKDGKIELLLVVFAGSGLDTKLNIRYIRPHQDRLKEPIEVQEGIWADKYCLIPELPQDDLGCFCHEIGHLLGLPDLYKEGYSPIVGSWCLMGIGDHLDNGKTPAHPSAWCKVHLGWKNPEIIEKPPDIHQIPAVLEDNGIIYKIEVQGSNGREYFLLENRQQKGFDRSLPGNGLLIWHVDEDNCVYQAPNSDPDRFFLTLVQSDGKNELQRDMTVIAKQLGVEGGMKELTGDEGDAYPGITVNRNFDENSTPNSNSYEGTKSLVRVTSISDSNDLMEAWIGVQKQSVIPPTTKSYFKQDETRETKTYELVIKSFIDFMSLNNKLNPYQEGYEAGKLDIIQNLKELEDLNSYRKGYREGYRQGFKNALKKSE